MAAHYFDTVQHNITGKPIAGATIDVFTSSAVISGSVAGGNLAVTGARAVIYSDDGVTVVSSGRVTTDAYGFFEFWTDDPSVVILVSYEGAGKRAVTDVEVIAATSGPAVTALEARVVTLEATVSSYGATIGGLAADSGSSLVGFIQAGTGALGRNVQAKARDVLSVMDFGAVGDGVASDQTAVAAAIAAAYTAGKELFWPSGTYLTTATIPNLHNVKHHGAGKIKRGAVTFAPNAKQGQTNTIYVATTGSDTNDGLDSTVALATIQKAFDVLDNYGRLLEGTWVIQCAAGTYTGAAYPTRLMSTNRVVLKGPDVARDTPTMIVDGTGSPLTYGLYFNDHAFVELRDFIVRNYTVSGAYGILFNRQGWDVNLHNVRCISNDSGAAFIGTGTVQWQWGGVYTNVSYGIVCQDRCRFTLGWQGSTVYSGAGAFLSTDGIYVSSNGGVGVEVTRQSYGYLQYSRVESNVTGMVVNRNTRIRNLGNVYVSNSNAAFVVGPMAMSNSASTNTLTSNGNGNVPIYQGIGLDGDSNISTTKNLGMYAMLGCDVTSRANPAGTALAEHVPSYATLPGNVLTSNKAMIRIMARGTISKGSAASLRSYTIRSYVGGNFIAAMVIPTTQALSGEFYIEVVFSASASNAQVGFMRFVSGTYLQETAIASARDLSVNSNVTFYTARDDTLDSATFTFCSAELAGWSF